MVSAVSLLADNDWRQLEQCVRRGEPVQIVRTLGQTEVVAEVDHAPPVWGGGMLVGVTVRGNGRITRRQWFASVDEARRIAK